EVTTTPLAPTASSTTQTVAFTPPSTIPWALPLPLRKASTMRARSSGDTTTPAAPTASFLAAAPTPPSTIPWLPTAPLQAGSTPPPRPPGDTSTPAASTVSSSQPRQTQLPPAPLPPA